VTICIDNNFNYWYFSTHLFGVIISQMAFVKVAKVRVADVQMATFLVANC